MSFILLVAIIFRVLWFFSGLCRSFKHPHCGLQHTMKIYGQRLMMWCLDANDATILPSQLSGHVLQTAPSARFPCGIVQTSTINAMNERAQNHKEERPGAGAEPFREGQEIFRDPTCASLNYNFFVGVPASTHRRECNQSRAADSEQLVGRCPVDRKSNRTTGKVLWHWSHSWWDTSSDSSKALPQELEIPDFYLPEGFAMLAGGHPVAPSPDQDVQKWPIDGIQTWHCPFPHQTRKACQLPSNLHASASPSSEKVSAQAGWP